MFNTETELDDVGLNNQLTINTKRKFGDAESKLIDSIITEDGFDEGVFKENLITFSDALRGNKRVTPEQYIKAVQYVSHLASGLSQVRAYRATFPDRCERKGKEGTIRGSASLYHRTDLVQKIVAMSQVPMHLIFMSERYKAVEKLVSLMNNPDASHRIQMESADKLLNHVKPPEESKLTLDVNMNNDIMQDLDKKLEELAKQQIEMLKHGHTAKDIVDAEIVRKSDD